MARRQNREVAELTQMLDELEAKLGLGPLPALPAKRRKAGGAGTGLVGGGQAGGGKPPAPESPPPAASGSFYPLPERMRGPRRHRPRTSAPPGPLSPSTSSGQALRGEGEDVIEGDEVPHGAGRALVPYKSQSLARIRTGGRRMRRWGDAARKAAQREIADGPSTGSGRGPSTGSGRGPSTGSGRTVWLRSLRAVREAFPLSQQELADRARLARSTIAALEAGRRRAYPSTRRVIARVLEVEVGEIGW